MKFKLSTKLQSVGGLLILVALAIGIIGITGIRRTNAGLETVYNDRVVPLKQLKAIADAYAVSIIDAANKANAGLVSAENTLQGIDTASANIRENWKAYMATTLTLEESGLAAEATQLFQPADAAVARFRQFLVGKTGLLTGQLGAFDGPLYAQIDPISSKITELVDLQLRVAREEYLAAQQRFQSVLWLSFGALIGGVTLAGGLGWKIVRAVTKILQQVAEQLAQGSQQTTTAAREVSSSSQSLAEGASEQAASLEETSAALEEISSMTRRNAENAANVAGMSQQTNQSAHSGLARISEMERTLGAIQEAVGEMQTAVGAMQSSSQEISKIIKTIDEIAFQTNLLALNAAVEAARAGEAGAGFAVVADEVRALAQRSAQAARDTSEKIEAAVKRSESGVVASGKVAQSLVEVEGTAESIEQAFAGIVAQIKTMDQIIAEIAAATKEQSQGITEVSTAVTQMDKVTQAIAAGAEENASASEEMNSQADAVHEIVDRLETVVFGQATTTLAPPAAVGPKPPKWGKPVRPGKPTNLGLQPPVATPAAVDLDIPMPAPLGHAGAKESFKDF